MASFLPVRSAPYDEKVLQQLNVSLVGKSVLITGASRGVGQYITEGLAQAGATPIAVVGLSKDRIEAARERFAAKFPRTTFVAFAADITDEAAVAQVLKQFGGAPDVLVNNAGDFPDDGAFVDQDLTRWWRGYQINVLGSANVTQKFLQARRESKTQEPAVVLNTSTMAAHFRFPLSGWSGYTSSKAAFAKMFEFIRLEHPDVRFVNIHPGVIESDGYTRSGAPTPPTGMTDGKLAGQFFAWAATPAADFLNGRFAWAEWEIEDLLKKKDVIVEQDLLLLTVDGFEKGF